MKRSTQGWALGTHRFKVGQRVRPSAKAVAGYLFPKTRRVLAGTGHSETALARRVEILADGRKCRVWDI
jgi:hypothetical protein